jgi:hypothetical protein
MNWQHHHEDTDPWVDGPSCHGSVYFLHFFSQNKPALFVLMLAGSLMLKRCRQ